MYLTPYFGCFLHITICDYSVWYHGFVCGALGALHPENMQVMTKVLKIHSRYARKMVNTMTVSLLRSSTAIWYEHTSSRLRPVPPPLAATKSGVEHRRGSGVKNRRGGRPSTQGAAGQGAQP
eukprot:GHVU01018872.1.p3 GENE.GHVU01018872.1~~GHVU01018872.1.p3  ORF type:complete len:122 (-),score=9.59 GHVU01018872.1:55-420(-)